MKIRTRGKQAFNVPNNAEGHKFMELFQKFRNRGWYFRARGRGSREYYGNQASIEQAHAEWLAVYMEHSKAWSSSPTCAPWVRREGPMTRINPDHVDVNVDQAGYVGPAMPGLGGAEPVRASPSLSASIMVNDEVIDGFGLDIAGNVVPGGIFSVNVADWSSPIMAGDNVALGAETGLAYAPGAHGWAGDNQIGVAINDHVGGIREGEATVQVHIQGPLLNAVPPEQPVPAPQAKEEDVAELTPEESGLLEDILESTFANWAGNISDEKQALFDTLMNKLVD